MSSEKLKLFHYQKAASSFIQRIPRAILRLDTGLGKTAVCIDAVKKLDDVKNILVIAPAFLKENWLREIDMWGGYKSKRALGIEKYWSIISYTKLAGKGHLDKILKTKWDIIICDEAHYLKNWEAKRTRNIVLELLPKCKRVVLSTATPFVRSAADLHPLFSTCEPGKWGKLRAFQERYCLKKHNPFKRWERFDFYGANPQTVGELKTAGLRFMIKYKKSDVLSQLPEKIETDITVKVGKGRLLKKMDTEQVIDVDTGRVTGGLTSILSREARLLGLDKVGAACEWINSFGGGQLVVFCKHLDVQEAICRHLEDEGIASRYIHGGVKQEVRDEIIQKFQAGRFSVLVATMASCGVGINLTAASSALFVELPWSYAELKQCEDRLHRIGQKNCVNIYRLIGEGSVDDLVVGVLNRKIDGEELSIGGM